MFTCRPEPRWLQSVKRWRVPELRDNEIDRLWLQASITAWIPISGIVLLIFLGKEAWYGGSDAALSVLPLGVVVGLMWGAVITLHVVSIPLRILLNLVPRTRRWKCRWETVACAAAFAALCWAAYAYFAHPLE